MGELAVRQDNLPGVPEVSEATSMVVGLLRAARDPSVDADKMERMMAMYERIEARQAEQAFDQAMAEAQGEMGRVATDKKNSQTHSEYASYAAIDRAIRPIYAKYGFALSFGTSEGAAQDCVRVTCIVSHKGGYSRNYQVDMPADGKGAKGGDVMTRTHAVGAALSYGSRYLLKLIFNVAVGEDDDDGNGASGGSNGPISTDQLKTLRALIESYAEHGADAEKLCAFFKVAALPDLTAKQYRTAIESLNVKYAGRKSNARG